MLMKLNDIKNKMALWEPGVIGDKKEFAVLIPLVERQGELHFLFEKRAEGIKQPGDVCFPGGVMEPGETPLQCAVRETEEEIGIPTEKIRVIGQFDSIYEVRNITMHTIIGVIEQEDLKLLNPNPDEVAKVFTVPFKFFEEVEPYIYEYDVVQKVDDFPYEEMGVNPDYKWRVGRNLVPIWHYGEGEDRQLLWGLTALITLWLKQKLEEYNESVK